MFRSVRRYVLAFGLAGLLAFTQVTPPASAADLGMPVKAPPITQAPPPEFDWLPLLALLLIGTGVGLCIAFCEQHGGPPPPATSGGHGSG